MYCAGAGGDGWDGLHSDVREEVIRRLDYTTLQAVESGLMLPEDAVLACRKKRQRLRGKMAIYGGTGRCDELELWSPDPDEESIFLPLWAPVRMCSIAKFPCGRLLLTSMVTNRPPSLRQTFQREVTLGADFFHPDRPHRRIYSQAIQEAHIGFDHATAALGNSIFCIGGWADSLGWPGWGEYSDRTAGARVLRASADGAWSSCAAMGLRRHSFAAATREDRCIAVFAGYGDSSPIKDVQEFNVDTNCWLPCPELPSERHRHCAAFMDGRYIVTGGNPWGELDTQNWDPRMAYWEKGPLLTAARVDSCILTHRGKLWLLGGRYGQEKTVEYLDARMDRFIPHHKSLGLHCCDSAAIAL